MNEEQVERARRFLRDIRDAVMRHPVVSQTSVIRLHERREWSTLVLRLSGTLDGMLIELLVHLDDDAPQQPRFEYSSSLERLRSGRVMSLGASAFTAAHDQACRTHYPDSDRWKQTLSQALEQSFAALCRGSLH